MDLSPVLSVFRGRKRRPDVRPSACRRGYDARWRKLRISHLRAHPLCEACARVGIMRDACVVDHIVPHRGDTRKLYDAGNLQSLCKRCHDRKTATQDGAFGHIPGRGGQISGGFSP